jgi:chromosomal replication initiation ATPase DnaA
MTALAVDVEALRRPVAKGSGSGVGSERWLASIDKQIAKLDCKDEERRSRLEAHAAQMRSRAPVTPAAYVSIPSRFRKQIEPIRIAVEREFNLKISIRSNCAAIVEARQVAWYLSRQLTALSTVTIGRILGCFHHTTVIHGIRKIECQIREDRELRAIVGRVARCLEPGPSAVAYDSSLPDESGAWAI